MYLVTFHYFSVRPILCRTPSLKTILQTTFSFVSVVQRLPVQLDHRSWQKQRKPREQYVDWLDAINNSTVDLFIIQPPNMISCLFCLREDKKHIHTM